MKANTESGRLIESFIEKRETSVQAIADKLGVGRNAIYVYLRDGIPLYQSLNLAAALDIEPNVIFAAMVEDYRASLNAWALTQDKGILSSQQRAAADNARRPKSHSIQDEGEREEKATRRKKKADPNAPLPGQQELFSSCITEKKEEPEEALEF